jgi:hypothetical protein
MAWFGWPPNRWRRPTSGSGEHCTTEGDDCQAFLNVHFTECMSAHTDYAPTWVWTNLLTYETDLELRQDRAAMRRACSRSTPMLEDEPWRAARTFLADEVLDLAAMCCSLGEMQRSTLVPLELCLAARAEANWWRAAGRIGDGDGGGTGRSSDDPPPIHGPGAAMPLDEVTEPLRKRHRTLAAAPVLPDHGHRGSQESFDKE